jgi:hypothetical protein
MSWFVRFDTSDFLSRLRLLFFVLQSAAWVGYKISSIPSRQKYHTQLAQ